MPASPHRIKPPSPEQIAAGDVLTLAELLAQEAGDDPAQTEVAVQPLAEGQIREIGGRRDGPDPTRYGDWEKNGRCIDF